MEERRNEQEVLEEIKAFVARENLLKFVKEVIGMTPEEYIKAYTRGCSNELIGGGYHEWLTPENALAAVELAREEMMKDAVEVEVFDDWQYGKDADRIAQPAIKLRCPKLKIGQKIKVIIIKE